MKSIMRRGGSEFPPDLTADERELILRIRSHNLTYLSPKKLADIARTCRSIEQKGLPGIFIEAGCALGGSAILIATAKRPDRSFFMYDVFGMIPPPTKEDTEDVHARYDLIAKGASPGIGGEEYYGYKENLREVVEANLADFEIDVQRQAVSLVMGMVEDTMTIEQPVAFAHVDVDWYSPVSTCLRRIFPHIVPGGCIILDDYYSWGGCRKAVDEYLLEVAGQYVQDDSSGAMKLTKVRS